MAIVSIVKNHHLPAKLKFYVMTRDQGTEEGTKFKSFIEKQNVDFEYIDIAKINTIEMLPTCNEKYSVDIFSRFFIPTILKGTCEKVIYLDGDLVVLGDIEELYGFDLRDNCLGAIADAPLRDHVSRLKLERTHVYFNSGVLLINIKKWFECDLTSRLIDYIVKNKEIITLPGQDALNCIVRNEWTRISPYWNFQTHAFYLSDKELNRYIGGRVDMSCARIVHYTGGPKPWSYMHDGNLNHLYLKYRKFTPWGNVAYPDRTLLNIFKVNMRLLLRKFGVLWRLPEKWRLFFYK